MPVNPVALPRLNIDWQTVDPQTSPLHWLAEHPDGRAAMADVGVLLHRMQGHAMLEEPARRLEQLWQRLGFTGMRAGDHRTFRFEPGEHRNAFARPADAHDIAKLVMQVCDQIGVTLDRIRPQVADNQASEAELQALSRHLGSAFEDHMACGPGVLSRLQDCLLYGLTSASDRSIARTVTRLRDQMFDDAVIRFYVRKPLLEGETIQIRLGNQIHYRNAARNIVGKDFQVSGPVEDRYALSNDVRFDRPLGLFHEIESALQTHRVARALAQAYLSELETLHGGWQQDYTTLTSRIREAQSTQLDAAYGPVERLDYLLTLEQDGLSVSSTRNPDLLAVHLYRNAQSRGLVAPLGEKKCLPFETGGQARQIMTAGPLVWSEPLLIDHPKGERTDRWDIPIEPLDTQVIGCWMVAERQPWLDRFIAAFTSGLTDPSMLVHNRRTVRTIGSAGSYETTLPSWLLDALKYGVETNPEALSLINPIAANPGNLVIDVVCRLERVMLCQTLTSTDRLNLINALTNTVRDDVLNHYLARSERKLKIPELACGALAAWLVRQERYATASKILETNLVDMSPTILAFIASQIPEPMLAGVMRTAIRRVDKMMTVLAHAHPHLHRVLDAPEAQHERIAIRDLIRNRLMSTGDDAAFEELLSIIRQGQVSPVLAVHHGERLDDIYWLTQFSLHHDAQQLGQLIQAVRDGMIAHDAMVRENASGSSLRGLNPATTRVMLDEVNRKRQVTWNELLTRTSAGLIRKGMVNASIPTPHLDKIVHLFSGCLRLTADPSGARPCRLSPMPLLEAVNKSPRGGSLSLNALTAFGLTRLIMKAIVREPDAAILRRLLDEGELSLQSQGRTIGSRHDKSLLDFARSYGSRAAIDLLEQHRVAADTTS